MSWLRVAAPPAPKTSQRHFASRHPGAAGGSCGRHNRDVARTPKTIVVWLMRAASGIVRSWSFLTRRAVVLKFRPHHGAVAQLVAHLVRNEGVRGSSPLSSTERTYNRRSKALSGTGIRAFAVVWGEVQQLLTRVGACRRSRTCADRTFEERELVV